MPSGLENDPRTLFVAPCVPKGQKGHSMEPQASSKDTPGDTKVAHKYPKDVHKVPQELQKSPPRHPQSP